MKYYPASFPPLTEASQLPSLLKGGAKKTLWSFFFLNKSGEELDMAGEKEVSLFLDSGAFSAYTKGIEINLDDYIQFIKDNIEFLDVYANLDVIGDPEATLKNQKKMEKAGLNPLPCFHYGENYKYFKYYLENYDYVALGGIAVKRNRQGIVKFLDQCFDMVCDQPSRMPKVKIHGFGVTGLPMMMRYPWWSVDSTSWVLMGRFGNVYVPRRKNGKWIYDESTWNVCISNRSPGITMEGKHFDTFSNAEKQEILAYLEEKVYLIGLSSFKAVKAKSYELKENERWSGKEAIQDEVRTLTSSGLLKGERMVEIIEEAGLSNDYKQRDELNIIYFLDLEKNMPDWPWPFKLKRQRGFMAR